MRLVVNRDEVTNRAAPGVRYWVSSSIREKERL
jgi:hypothetical protein